MLLASKLRILKLSSKPQKKIFANLKHTLAQVRLLVTNKSDY